MKYVMMFMLMFTMTSTAMAGLDLSGLTTTQLAELTLQAEKMKTEKSTTAVKQVSEWANIGKELGSGLAATANELGVTANELAKTPVGVFAMVLIAWNYMGESVIGVIFGFLWLATMIPAWLWLYRRKFVIMSVDMYDKGARDDGLRKVIHYVDRNFDNETVEHFFYLVAVLLIGAVGILTIFV